LFSKDINVADLGSATAAVIELASCASSRVASTLASWVSSSSFWVALWQRVPALLAEVLGGRFSDAAARAGD
jgi:hypothetical protein